MWTACGCPAPGPISSGDHHHRSAASAPHRAAPIAGALLGNITRYLPASALVTVLGLAIGYRPADGAAGVLAGIGLLVLFLLTLASNFFVAPRTMSGWLQAVVRVNPVSRPVTAERGLLGRHAASRLARVLIAVAAVTAVFAPLTGWLCGRQR